MKIDGRCHCGEITFEAEVDPEALRICHCTDCQTLSGSAFRANIPAPAEHFVLLSGTPKTYQDRRKWQQTPSRFLRQLWRADLFLGGRKSAELWLACWDDQTARPVLTAAADLATVCAALGGRAHRRAGGRAGVKG